ncbi:MAG: formylmethanofuran dehydrogenase [Planctomycetes bacterium]|nr:formylmethanofuran dehydrogenase [Planctomycetota bacterium]
MATEFILIPGRTAKQGTALCEGKETENYQREITELQMNPDDMARLDISEGDNVRMWNDVGNVTVSCKSGKKELPPGLLFISYGDISSQLMAGETHGTGMPDSKGLDVWVEKADGASQIDDGV